MTIDERVEQALSDVSALMPTDDIERFLFDVAREYDLTVPALRLRAEKRFGDLNSLASDNKQKFESAQRTAELEALARQYFDKYGQGGSENDPPGGVEPWIISRLSSDVDLYDRDELSAIIKKYIFFDLDRHIANWI